jgi:ribonuclease BN (tRNA processing enzyme)
VELTVLGTAGTWPPAGGATCGFLLSHEGTNVWLDAGTGTFARLQERIGVDDVAALVVTHAHTDHFIDVVPAFYARHYGGLGTPGLPFYSPDGFVDSLSLLVSEGGKDVLRQAYEFRTVAGGDTFDIGAMRFTTFTMKHVGVNAVGYRVEAGGATLAYTGDTGVCDEALELARGADVLLCEATYQESSEQFWFHLSAIQAGKLATEAAAKRLILTHILPTLDPEISREEAATTFSGPVDLASDGLVLEIGP